MAINPEVKYAGKIKPSSTEYPYGEARNITLPGDGTGTPWEAALVNDLFGFQQALLSGAGITPSGDPETATDSQYLAALRALGVFKYASGATYSEGQYALTPQAVYRSLVDNNIGNDPDTDDGSNWERTPSQGETIVRTTGRPALKVLPTAPGRKASLPGLGGKTIFTFDDSDLSAEVSADQQEGVYLPPDSDPTGASGAWVRDGAEYELNLYWFGASGDYDEATETPGKIAVNATDNFDAFNGARLLLEHRNQGRLIVSGSLGNTDFWASNMPRFHLSDFEFYIERGTTVRMTTPSSFGTTLYVGEVGVSKNTEVTGGGTVRNYLPILSELALWQPNTSYPAETYVKTTTNSVYWTRDGGTTGTTEPTVTAGSETDGTVVWRDAINENGISMHGDDTRVTGMYVAEASNKGITCQAPPWRDAKITGCIVGKTHHDGIEMKGNQGAVGQEELFAARGIIQNNVVQSAGRHGIHVEQPSAGVNKNEDMSVLDNIVIECGVRDSDQKHDGIRVNRCIRPVVRGNKILSTTRNGVFIRESENVTGDINVNDYGLWAAFLQENNGVTLDSIAVTGACADGAEAVRFQENTGSVWVGNLTVSGTGHTYAYRGLGQNTTKVGNAQMVAGSIGMIQDNAPIIAASGIVGGFEGLVHQQGSASVASTARETFVSATGRRTQVLSGTIFGAAGIRLELIIDGGTTIVLGGTQSVDSAGNEFTVIPIPPVTSFDSLTIRANNNTGAPQTIAWNVVYT